MRDLPDEDATIDLERDPPYENPTTDLKIEDLWIKNSKVDTVVQEIEDHWEGSSTIDSNEAYEV